MRLKFTLHRPRLTEQQRQLLAFLLGREYAEPGPDPQVPANYRPYEPRHGTAAAPRRAYTTAPTKTPLDIAVARKLLVGRVRSAAERRAHPAAASRLAPAAHTAPPTQLLQQDTVDELFPPLRPFQLDDRVRVHVAEDSDRSQWNGRTGVVWFMVSQASIDVKFDGTTFKRRFRADELVLIAAAAPPSLTPPRIPHFDDLKAAQFASGRRRAPLPWALESPKLAAMLPAAPARHALPGGTK